jgi:hypothetical protein
VQEKEVKNFMHEEGYSNKAEFFRFLIKFYKYHKLTDQERFEKAADELQELMKKTANHPKFKKSLEEQLKDV